MLFCKAYVNCVLGAYSSLLPIDISIIVKLSINHFASASINCVNGGFESENNQHKLTFSTFP